MKSIFLCFALFIGIVFCYHDGPGACDQPDADMAVNPVDKTNGGYSITGLPAAYTAGTSYTVTLVGATAQFAGFLVYAQTTSGYRAGSWTPGAGGFTHVVDGSVHADCTSMGDAGNTLGHTTALSSAPSNSLVIGTWNAPKTGEGNVVFMGLAVRDQEDWWFMTPIAVTGPGSAPPAPTGGSTTTTTGSNNVGLLGCSFALVVALFSAVFIYSL